VTKSASLSSQAIKREPTHPEQTEAEGSEGRAEPGRGKVSQGNLFCVLMALFEPTALGGGAPECRFTDKLSSVAFSASGIVLA